MVVALANGLADRGHQVSLLTWDRKDATSFFELSPEITWCRIGIGDPEKAANLPTKLSRLPVIRRFVVGIRPDAIICFSGGPFQTLLAALLGSGPPIIASERNAPTVHQFVSPPWRKFIANQSYRFARAVTVQFERYRDSYPSYLRSRIVSVPNSVPAAVGRAQPNVSDSAGRFRLLSVGRLAPQKNYAVLLDAFASIATRLHNWELTVIGEGPERASLEARVASDPVLAGRVHFPGVTKDVNAAYRAAHLFCLPSLWEGFPNVLGEALAHGLPAVGFDGCAGVKDLIEDGVTGYLAPGNDDPVALASKLALAMKSPARLAEMGTEAVQSMQEYAPERVFDQWERLLEECIRLR